MKKMINNNSRNFRKFIKFKKKFKKVEIKCFLSNENDTFR